MLQIAYRKSWNVLPAHFLSLEYTPFVRDTHTSANPRGMGRLRSRELTQPNYDTCLSDIWLPNTNVLAS